MWLVKARGYKFEPGAILRNAYLFGEDLSKVDLSEADLTGVHITDVDLTNAIMPDGTIHD